MLYLLLFPVHSQLRQLLELLLFISVLRLPMLDMRSAWLCLKAASIVWISFKARLEGERLCCRLTYTNKRFSLLAE
jgi:hypothetical protein